MVTGYEVFEDGTLQEIELTKGNLDSTKVLCVVDDSSKSIYLWKGGQANIRKKFIGARVATNLRSEYGFNFKVRPVDEGEEPPTFFTALDGTTAAIKVIKPGEKAPPPRPPTPKVEKTQPAVEETTTASTAPLPRPQASRPTKPPPVPTATARPSSSGAAVQTVDQSMIDEMIKELETVAPPEGYQRELLIVYNTLFTVAEHRISVFGQEKIERRFEKVKDPPEGTFMAEGFIPRVIVKNGRVLGIELLKGTPDAILSPIKAEMKERLSDLITFFRTEVEQTPPKAAKTKSKAGKKKSKLVAK
ncbi:MAG: hypothetical protein GQ580_03225 [Candidatus Thorarchaeota archaeon]|nr:hypothetical protein [Candidatus Thorarchaeota archaeon]